jgi:hypothetical protein
VTPEQITVMEAALPPAMRDLPRDAFGRPIPWFVALPTPGEGRPLDLRIADARKNRQGFRDNLCWVCGIPLSRTRVFVGGPLSVRNRIFSDWASHYQCAEFSARFCPALNSLMHRRSGKEYPDDVNISPHALEHIPTVIGLLATSAKVDIVEGELFHPRSGSAEWWQGGRKLLDAEAGPIVEAYLSEWRKKVAR